MTIRCFVIDDEPLARLNLEVELASHPEFTLSGSEGDPVRALEQVVAETPDLVFLDVRMPGLDGLEVMSRLRARLGPEASPYVVLVTAFDRYALQAFEYEALDYLVKPFDSERFEVTIRRAARRIRQRQSGALASENASAERLSFQVSGGTVFLAPSDICWVESANHYLLLHVDTRTHLVRETMSRMEMMLEPHGFLRVHRGALVHPRHVREAEILSDGGRMLHITEGSRVRVSRRRWPVLRNRVL